MLLHLRIVSLAIGLIAAGTSSVLGITILYDFSSYPGNL